MPDKLIHLTFRIFAIFLGVSGILHAQVPTAGDCLGAFPVCQPIYEQTLSFIGSGNIQNEFGGDENLSCLVDGERNNSWYMVTVQTDGRFGFNIIPNCDNADYDWAVYRLTNASCQQIPTLAAVRCNYSSIYDPPTTGMNDGINPQDAPMLDVNAGEVFAIVINNYTGAGQCGYKLDFSISGARVYDDISPEFLPINPPIACGDKIIAFEFSEYVRCNSVRIEDFKVIGPPGLPEITILTVEGDACSQGGLMEKNFKILLSEPLNRGGEYRIEYDGHIEDNCGNFIPPRIIPFSIPVIEVDSSSTPAECAVNNGTATVIPSGGNPPYTYLWTPGNQTGQTATGLSMGRYQVRITDALGCYTNASVEVLDQSNFQVDLDITSDICSFGVGAVTVIASGGNPFTEPGQSPYSVTWNIPGAVVNQTTVENVRHGNYQVTVTDRVGCTIVRNFVVPDYRYDLELDFSYSPDTAIIPGMFPEVQFINQSQGVVRYHWDFGSDTSNLESPKYVFPSSGSYEVSLIGYNNYGCSDTITKTVRIAFLHTFFPPKAFSPNDDWVNDEYRIIITGIDTSSFLLEIYDRWGEMVFNTSDVNQAWNGRLNNTGKICLPGVYVFKATFLDQSDKRHFKTGRIVLVH